MSVGFLGGALRHAGRVTQGEDDWLLVEAGHVTDDLWSEDSWHGSSPNETGWLDGLNNVSKLLHLLMGMSKWSLVVRDPTGGPISDYQASGVLQPDLLQTLLKRDSFSLLHGHGNEVCNTNGSLTRPLKEESVIGQLGVGGIEGGQHSSHGHASRALNVVVEGAVFVTVLLQESKGVVVPGGKGT